MEAKGVKEEMGRLADLLSPHKESQRSTRDIPIVVQPFALLHALHILSCVEETSERKESF